MSKKLLWTTAVFIVFAFATLIVFFWVRDGSLEKAGASMDHLLEDRPRHRAGHGRGGGCDRQRHQQSHRWGQADLIREGV